MFLLNGWCAFGSISQKMADDEASLAHEKSVHAAALAAADEASEV